MPFQAGYIYPLVDAESYDDDYGTGFGFVAIAHDAEPGECYIHDAWIVDENGNVHPGYDANPVPVRLQDVIEDQGRPNPAPLPEPTSVFTGGFFR